jgi:YD repeat-containing protein
MRRTRQRADVAGQLPKKSELLVNLPTDICNTPDGMCLLPCGSFIISVPNFNNLQQRPLMMKITPANKAEVFLKLPDHPNTGKPVGPLGVCLAPNGDLFLADYQMTGERQSRVLRIIVKDGKAVDVKPVVVGFHVSNAVVVRGDYLYVSETQIDKDAKPATSGVMRFKLGELDGAKPVELQADERKDPHLVGTITTDDSTLPLGADGLCFDKAGNLYIGNFADGKVHRFTFDKAGKLTGNTIFAKAPFMKSCDGMVYDPVTEVIYVADSRANAIQMVFPNGTVKTLAQNGDTDGSDGGMDQPCEPLLRGREVIVSNMDWPVPGCINQKYDKPCTLSVIKLDR